MRITICAIDAAGGFGNYDGTLPWGCPIKADITLFKEITSSCGNVLCGVSTFESLPSKLKGRFNVVVVRPHTTIDQVRAKDGSYPDLILHKASSQPFTKLDDKLKSHGIHNYAVIGGAGLIVDALDSGLMDRAYLTIVEGDFNADIKMETPKQQLRVMKSHATKTDRGTLVFYQMGMVEH